MREQRCLDALPTSYFPNEQVVLRVGFPHIRDSPVKGLDSRVHAANSMDYLGSNWNVESLSERDLIEIHAKILNYSTNGNCYKTSTLLKEYGAKVIDLGCAVAVSMPGDKDECAKHAMILLT